MECWVLHKMMAISRRLWVSIGCNFKKFVFDVFCSYRQYYFDTQQRFDQWLIAIRGFVFGCIQHYYMVFPIGATTGMFVSMVSYFSTSLERSSLLVYLFYIFMFFSGILLPRILAIMWHSFSVCMASTTLAITSEDRLSVTVSTPDHHCLVSLGYIFRNLDVLKSIRCESLIPFSPSVQLWYCDEKVGHCVYFGFFRSANGCRFFQ